MKKFIALALSMLFVLNVACIKKHCLAKATTRSEVAVCEKHAHQRKIALIITLAVLTAGAAVAAIANNSGGGGGGSYGIRNANQANVQGCCSYHNWVQQDGYGNTLVFADGRVACNEGQPSPTCTIPR